MRLSIYFIAAALILAVRAESDEEGESSVLVLSKDNFTQTIEGNDYVLVEFYAPWCGHCKSLAPEYDRASIQLVATGSSIKLAKVDATVDPELAEQYGVKGYPTLYFFKSGTKKEYGGGRTASEIVSWVVKNSGPPAVQLNDVEAAKAFVGKDEVVVVGFFESDTSDEAVAYLAAAGVTDSVMFGIATSSEVAEAVGAKMETIVAFRPYEGEEKVVVFTGEFKDEVIVKFIQGEQLALLTKFSDETAPKIFGGEIKTHLLAFFAADSTDFDDTVASLKKVAALFKGKVLFVHIDTSEEQSDRIMEFFNLGKDDVPCGRLIEVGEEMRRYKPDFEGLPEDKVQQFVQDYTDGKIKPHLNTEDVPADWDKSPVKVLVGKNFNEVALDSSKHVFVEFYAPWCGHCKQLAPIWDDLGEHFKDNDDVVIAKMDSTKNEVDGLSVSGFPTLKFFPKDSDKVVDYSGGRTLDALVKYVDKRLAGTATDEDEGAEPEEPEEGGEPEPEEPEEGGEPDPEEGAGKEEEGASSTEDQDKHDEL